MGLDMSLSAEVDDGNEIEFGYWRKANAIHNWFVVNCQGGHDNCGIYPVSVEQLLELKKTCQQVLDNMELSKELLPTVGGFFFGSTEYNGNYLGDLKHTIEIINDVLLCGVKKIYYSSSW